MSRYHFVKDNIVSDVAVVIEFCAAADSCFRKSGSVESASSSDFNIVFDHDDAELWYLVTLLIGPLNKAEGFAIRRTEPFLLGDFADAL